MPAILAVIVCSIQWFLIGYTLTYSEGGAIFGDFRYAFHRNVLAEPIGTIPAVLFSFFQLVFQATVCAIAVGGASHMVWGGGFLMDLGVLDFAGGTPVHINSGATATAMSVYLSYPLFRSRKSATRTPSHLVIHRPVNSLCQLLAMISIWGSWLAFDAGTTLAFNFKSVMALCVTNLCAASGALTWMLYTYMEIGRWSLDSCFMGAVSGLIMITPSAGFIDLPTAFFFGILGALVCRQALRIKFSDFARRWRWVDHGDTFATHCIGGILATISTGFFARKEVAGYDGVTEIVGGVFFDGNARQLGIQIVEALVGFWWSFILSYIMYALVDCVPGFEVLAEDKDIILGLDASQLDEETLWAETQEYYPYAEREGELHLD
ncbi:Rh-like protein/ammonium transporter [Stemphylium lycopersici]|nr:Rh-like protein/ammonium transporter [Stemphylium lycopersici]